ncbi:hypothetical protein FHG87_011257 [Trinorchestia longiramus]|nr:hypothetical protein FHG87_011257 [Trinorchestia longiramus]
MCADVYEEGGQERKSVATVGLVQRVDQVVNAKRKFTISVLCEKLPEITSPHSGSKKILQDYASKWNSHGRVHFVTKLLIKKFCLKHLSLPQHLLLVLPSTQSVCIKGRQQRWLLHFNSNAGVALSSAFLHLR